MYQSITTRHTTTDFFVAIVTVVVLFITLSKNSNHQGINFDLYTYIGQTTRVCNMIIICRMNLNEIITIKS